MLDGLGDVAGQVMRGSQISSEKPDIAGDGPFQNYMTLRRAELAEDLQLSGASHSGHGAFRFTPRRIAFDFSFQDQQIVKAVGMAIAAAEDVFEISGFG